MSSNIHPVRSMSLPDRDEQGRPLGTGPASMAARLQYAARNEIRQALDARVTRRSRSGDTRGQRVAYPGRRADQLTSAFNLLATAGPYIVDGRRVEDRSELLFMTCGNKAAIQKLQRAAADLPEPAAGHARCALAFALGAQAIREVAGSLTDNQRSAAR
jgi:hypothetical protein